MEVNRGFIYGKNQETGEMIRLDRRSMAGGGHMLVLGQTGSGKSVFMKNEISQVLAQSNDTIYVFAENPSEYEKLFVMLLNFHCGEQGCYEAILEEGKVLLSQGKRIWVYFDNYFNDFTSDEWEAFLSFGRKARKAGVILTVAMQNLSQIPDEILPHLFSLFECNQIFDVDPITQKLVKFYCDELSEQDLDDSAVAPEEDFAKEMNRWERYLELQEQLEKEARNRHLMIAALATGICGAAVMVWKILKKK